MHFRNYPTVSSDSEHSETTSLPKTVNRPQTGDARPQPAYPLTLISAVFEKIHVENLVKEC